MGCMFFLAPAFLPSTKYDHFTSAFVFRTRSARRKCLAGFARNESPFEVMLRGVEIFMSSSRWELRKSLETSAAPPLAWDVQLFLLVSKVFLCPSDRGYAKRRHIRAFLSNMSLPRLHSKGKPFI